MDVEQVTDLESAEYGRMTCGHPLPPPGQTRITADVTHDLVAITHSTAVNCCDVSGTCTHYTVDAALTLGREILKNVALSKAGSAGEVTTQ